MLLLAEANHRSRIITLSYCASHPATSAQRSNLKHVCYALLKPLLHIFKQKKDLVVLNCVYTVISDTFFWKFKQLCLSFSFHFYHWVKIDSRRGPCWYLCEILASVFICAHDSWIQTARERSWRDTFVGQIVAGGLSRTTWIFKIRKLIPGNVAT